MILKIKEFLFLKTLFFLSSIKKNFIILQIDHNEINSFRNEIKNNVFIILMYKLEDYYIVMYFFKKYYKNKENTKIEYLKKYKKITFSESDLLIKLVDFIENSIGVEIHFDVNYQLIVSDYLDYYLFDTDFFKDQHYGTHVSKELDKRLKFIESYLKINDDKEEKIINKKTFNKFFLYLNKKLHSLQK